MKLKNSWGNFERKSILRITQKYSVYRKKLTHIRRHHLDRKKKFLRKNYNIPYSQNLNFSYCGVTLKAQLGLNRTHR